MGEYENIIMVDIPVAIGARKLKKLSFWRSVCAWEDPHDSAVYCVASDHNVTVLSGTNRYGVVRLWDRRRTRPVKVSTGSCCTPSQVNYASFRLGDC